ncbi:phosphotransferase [Paenibacillus physcomitrellae]|uniref:Aminoglycoside phosphotransferase domain-containing protein n=1 Tax=Paenibacillus physcomitrellae TaxID=1619311 RepID=A0ABQ1G6T4_9BACL|nr:phosphotransferase [Paenibacillus physcomitrellae]GGA37738.1 hypothetical protein GCM10010917_23660 [Paenibacillus physcomitrellae]
MIGLSVPLFASLLDLYRLPSSVQHYFILHEDQRKADGQPRIRIIVAVQIDTGQTYVIKIIKEAEHPAELMNRQSEFSETLRANGIPVPKRHPLPDHRYCKVLALNGIECAVTIEDQEGQRELPCINPRYVRELAVLMANMHKISARHNCRLNHGTIWDLFDPRSDISRGGNQFLGLPDKDGFNKIDVLLYERIKQLYITKRNELKRVWPQLPSFAVQGDFSTNNVMLNKDGSIRAVIDFNIAGDEKLVNDLVTEGIFICFIMDLEPGLPEECRHDLLRLFVRTYREQRPLANEEESVLNLLYQLVFPFLWTNIELLEELLQADPQTANRHLHNMLRELEEPFFKE